MVKRILPVYFIVFLGYIGYSLFLTIFAPALLHGNLLNVNPHAKVLILGTLIFMYPFGQFLSSPILGALSDRFGRKPLLMYSLAITTIMYVLIGIFLIHKCIAGIMVALFIAGLSEGNITIAQSAIADISSKQDRHRLFGYIFFASACSYLIGPMLGGWLSTVQLGNGPSYPLPFFIVAGMLLLAFFWTWLSFKETAVKQHHVSYFEGFTNIKNLFLLKHLRYWFLVNFCIYLTIFGFLQGFPIYVVAKFAVQVGKLSLMIAWTDIPFLVVNLLLIGLLAKKFRPVRLLLFFVLFLALIMLGMLLPRHEDGLWPFLIAAGFACAVLLPMTSSWISILAHETEQGKIMGLNGSLGFFTEALSGLLVGLLASAYIWMAMLVLGIMGFVAALLLVVKRNDAQTV